jgi:undecaprenyl-diphosphatase
MAHAEQRREGSYACLIVSLLLFGSMGLAIALGVTDSFDVATRARINSLAFPGLTLLAHSLSLLGSVAVLFPLAALTAAALAISKRPRSAMTLLLTMAAAAILNPVVKLAFARSRPEAFFGNAPDSFSFASGHALFSACYFSVVAGIIAAHVTKVWQRAAVWVVSCTFIAGIGWSRVYLGVHYLTDVMAGFALAALIICVVRSILSKSTSPVKT